MNTPVLTPAAPKADLFKAICAVMADVERVPKNGKNQFHGYKYATEADLVAVVRPSMAKHGLALLPNQVHATDPDAFGNVRVTVEYLLVHSSGQTHGPLTAFGVGNDRARNGNDGDKAIYKALTGANKYLLFKLFQVDTGDDPEAETVSNEDRPPAQQTPPSLPAAVVDFVARLKAACEKGDATELMKFEQETGNADRIAKLRKEFVGFDAVKAVLARVDAIYAAMGA